MKKCIHVVYINDFHPELWALTFHYIKLYALTIKSEINVITQRKFLDWHIYYEKMQVHQDGKHYDYNFLVDADVLIHPEFPDFSTILLPYHIAINDCFDVRDHYNEAAINDYFHRDGRFIGISSNAVISSKATHDLWEPLNLSQQETTKFLKPHTFIDEYCLSQNLSRFGLKYHGITWESWQRKFLVHCGGFKTATERENQTMSKEKVLQTAKDVVKNWNL